MLAGKDVKPRLTRALQRRNSARHSQSQPPGGRTPGQSLGTEGEPSGGHGSSSAPPAHSSLPVSSPVPACPGNLPASGDNVESKRRHWKLLVPGPRMHTSCPWQTQISGGLALPRSEPTAHDRGPGGPDTPPLPPPLQPCLSAASGQLLLWHRPVPPASFPSHRTSRSAHYRTGPEHCPAESTPVRKPSQFSFSPSPGTWEAPAMGRLSHRELTIPPPGACGPQCKTNHNTVPLRIPG